MRDDDRCLVADAVLNPPADVAQAVKGRLRYTTPTVIALCDKIIADWVVSLINPNAETTK